MNRVFTCLLEQHNLWIVLVAACVCVLACVGAFFILGSVSANERHRHRWLFLAGAVIGSGTWATHFISMLGYNPGFAIGFDLGYTLLSCVVCIVGAWGALEIAERFPTNSGRATAGIVLGAAIVAMHFSGTMGIEAAARKVLSPTLVVLSAMFSAGFATGAIQAFALAPPRYRLTTSAALLLLAIVSLHFTAMGALTLVPDPRIAAPEHGLDRPLLAATIAVGAAGALLVAIILAFADRRVAATELAAARHAAAMALHDALTGLPNRRGLREGLKTFLDDHRTQQVAVVAVDLDRFKPVNDLYGHAVGDELLVKVARLLGDYADADGMAARLGGDEFILVLQFESEDELIGRLSSLVARFDEPISLAEREVSIGGTLGVALYPVDGDEPDVLMRRADMALYRAKGEGRGRFAFFEQGMDARVQERAALERDLRNAVKNDQIVPHFQPLVRLSDGAVTGYEILARWQHPTRGLVEPTQFVQIAQESGVIGDMTFNILRRACRTALDWPNAPRISLNIAPIQLHDAALPQKILKVLSECGFPPQRLEIEITEEALVADFELARTLLVSLKNIGVHVALDDFGTGYSSLRHLRELPFDDLKIDRSFVNSMMESEDAHTIVRTIVQLARNLGLGVTAEGIEDEAQAQELQALGCDRGQGFLLGRPAAEIDGKPATEGSQPEAVERRIA